jgi:dihydroorotate dehydrogenase (fumarate)
MRHGLEDWMERHNTMTLDDMRGRSSLQHTPNPSAFERANYIRVLHSWTADARQTVPEE